MMVRPSHDLHQSWLGRFVSLLEFVVLDATEPLPLWLPDTRVRFNLEMYGVEQAIGAIKRRVEETGGVLQKPSPLISPSGSRRKMSLGKIKTDYLKT
jgi:hypothetical protein